MLPDVIRLFDDIGVSAADLELALNSPEINAAVVEKAHEAQEYWKSIAPVFGDGEAKRAERPEGEPGQYRDSIEIEYKETVDGLEARVGTDLLPLAEWIEYGTKKNGRARLPSTDDRSLRWNRGGRLVATWAAVGLNVI